MLNSDLEWIEIFPFGNGSTSGGDIIIPPGDDEEENDIIYDGGVV